jgi:hypothetical protein
LILSEVKRRFVGLSILFDLHLITVCFFENCFVHDVQWVWTKSWLCPFVLIMKIGISHEYFHKLRVLSSAFLS